MNGVIRTAQGLALAALLLAAVSLPAQTPYQREISTMQRTAAAFDRCSSLIERATTEAEMVAALATTAAELRALFSDMTSVSRSHPDWSSSPPRDVAPVMKLFDSSVSRLFEEALPKARAFVNEHPANQSLQSAFNRVNAILYSQ